MIEISPKHLVLIFSSLLIGSCATDWQLDRLKVKKCAQRGGVPDFGLNGYYGCGNRYEDAGKKCNSSRECLGDCLLPSDWKSGGGEEVVGECEHNDLPWEDGLCIPIEKKDENLQCIQLE